MQAEPYASARRVFWVVDNGAAHRNWAAAARLSDAYPNARMIHMPVHASWLNQAQFTALRWFTLDGTDHPSHEEQASMIRRYIIWRNNHAYDERFRASSPRQT